MVQRKMKTKKEEKDSGKTHEQRHGGTSICPRIIQKYQKSKTTSRIMKKYNVNSANTIKRSLVRPKNKGEPQKMCEGVYSITCNNCNATYIGETKHTLGTRIKEHKEDAV